MAVPCVLWIVGPRPLDGELVGAAGLSYERLDVGGIHGMAPCRAVLNFARLALSVPRAVGIIRRFRPDVVLVGGGYVCAPVAVAAWLSRVPMVTLCLDVVPGWAARLTARLSTRVAAAFPEALKDLPRARVTGYPLRPELLNADRGRARRHLGLTADEQVVLAFGGSQGSRAINEAIAGALPQILPAAQVFHVTGHGPDATNATVTCADHGPRYHVFSFLDSESMANALAAADLVICRAGAATMAELPVVGAPAIVVPGEFSAQEGNARALAEHGAAVIIRDRDLSAARLGAETVALLNDAGRLAEMARASRSLAHRDATAQVAAMVTDVARHGR